MEFFVFLVIAIIISFVLLVVWTAARVAKLSGTASKLEQIERELDRTNVRLASVEKRFSQTPGSPLQSAQPHAAPVVQPAELHIRPVKPAPLVVPPISAQPMGAASVPTKPPAAEPPKETVPASHPSLPAATSGPSTRARTEGAPRILAASDMKQADPVKRAISLEERLGQNWLNKLGIIALVTGLALLLGYQLRNLGPAGKSVTGFFISTAILATGLVLERRNRYRMFARAIIGGGWALLFFVTFALFHVQAMQVLHSQATDLVLMLVVASAMVVHSLRYRSQVVTSLAFLLGFLTVAISHVTVFSLVAGAILATGLLAVAFRQRWFVLALCGLMAVYLNHGLWLHRLLPNRATPGHPFPEFMPSAVLLLFYWLIFRLFYIFRAPEKESDRVCSTLNVLLNSAGLLMLLKYQSAHPEWAYRGLLALGTAEMLLAFFARRRHHNAFVVLTCIASLCLLAAVPFHFAGTSWSLMWLLQAEMLFSRASHCAKLSSAALASCLYSPRLSISSWWGRFRPLPHGNSLQTPAITLFRR